MSQSFPLTSHIDRIAGRLSGTSPAAVSDPSLIWAAVAVVLTPEPDSLLLIRRAERSGDPWSGHMALPGGRRDPEDADLLATAVRETLEEVQVDLSAARRLGLLPDIAPRIPTLPPIAVRPFVFALAARPPLHLSPEVTAARWTPLDELLRPGVYRQVTLEVGAETRTVPAYHLSDGIVWGMTERILQPLVCAATG